MIRVLLADDQVLFRAGLRVMIDAAADLEVVGEAATGRTAVDLARRIRPDVLLMDIRMPDTDGLAATRQVTGDPELDDVRVLILTTFEIEEYVFEALRSGAAGFIGKGAAQVVTIIAVLVTQTVVEPAILGASSSVGRLMPSIAAEGLRRFPATDLLPALPAAVVLAAWCAVALATGLLRIGRADLT